MTPTTELIEAAKAVIARWDSTDWKAAPTAEVMSRLRNALAELSRREEVKPAKCWCWKNGLKGMPPPCVRWESALSASCVICGHDRACHGGEK